MKRKVLGFYSLFIIIIFSSIGCEEGNIQNEPPEGSVWVHVANRGSHGPLVMYDASNGKSLIKVGNFYDPKIDVYDKED